MRKFKILFYFLLLIVLLSVSALYFCNRIVDRAAAERIFSSTADLPYNKTGLLLGTSKFLENGHKNPYYVYRVQAAEELLKAGKIAYLGISGDNSRKDYDEPTMMKRDLMAAGIDSARLFLDYAGFRTFDSMVRVREIFGQDSVTVISQQFHNERALFIAEKEGIYALAFNARDVGKRMGFRTQLRERFARVKVFIDYLVGTGPKFLGPRVQLPA